MGKGGLVFDGVFDFVEDFGDLDDAEKYESDAEAFKRRYKEFYSDIKLSHKEDW